jgi:type II secretory pathway component PulF
VILYAEPSTIGRTEAVGSVARYIASGIAWTFAVIPVFVVIGIVLALTLNPETAYLGVACVCVLVIALGASARAARRKRARAILAYVAQAVQMNLPMSTILEAAARSESPRVARRIDRLRAAIEDGWPVGDAVASAVPQVPQRIVDLANTAERDGRLPQVLKRLVDEHYPAGFEYRSLGLYKSYALFLILAISLVITLLTIFIIPKFEQIFHDFKAPLPAVTINVIELGQYAPFLCIIAVVATLVAEGRALRQLLSQGKPRFNPLKTPLDILFWHIPILGTMIRNRGLADVCNIIAGSVEAGRPVEQAIAQAIQPYLNAVLRSRINTWAELTAAGIPLADAAHQARLPDLVAGLAGTAIRAGNLPSALRFLAQHYESSFSRTAVLVQAAAVPAIVLSMGAIVMAVALAMFEPIIILIQQGEHYTRYW